MAALGSSRPSSPPKSVKFGPPTDRDDTSNLDTALDDLHERFNVDTHTCVFSPVVENLGPRRDSERIPFVENPTYNTWVG